ncbi:hypothetical protein GCM10011316_24890 [Roseibium aquae]|uniref:PilZ domain-containing protein n=1 Tax=Roseibium aquae TaxID=1323746 RepID=A0A916X260_9HYPH|nr:PilZ domain-containing protein [Roseibium aquae]GGB51914.1 hypothetical protein GCM10011316_24890 [Roseibium aquae]
MSMIPLDNIQPDAVLPVFVVDLANLACMEAQASKICVAGCRLYAADLPMLHDIIGIRIPGRSQMIKGRVMASHGAWIEVSFEFDGEAPMERRDERRRPVKIPASISDRKWTIMVECTIIDASKKGCKIQGNELGRLPNDITLRIQGLDLPVRGKIVWRKDDLAGVELMWQFSRSPDARSAQYLD